MILAMYLRSRLRRQRVSASVSALQNIIKGAKKRRFDLVDADDLELWKVDLPVDNALKRTLESLELNEMDSLSPVDEMLEVFGNAPQRKHLHIVIQGPPAVSSGPLHLKLNCIVLGNDPRRVFEIKVAPTASVSALQNVIKGAKKPQFDHITADSLELWKVDPPVDVTIENLRNLTLDPMKSLSPVAKLSKLFSEQPNEEHLHIVVQPQHTGKLFVSLPPIP
ncbi:hypothetical protein F4604DRAFT_251848 [Suillus subluteus]|nr:hypothetical protein F4604DRAFT_251848 [Suillus subluteus]